jgi:hypothetical protein
MTEAEWLTATDPKPMLVFFKNRTTCRKLRLLGCGCCRRIWHLLILRSDERSKRIVELVEAVADGKTSELQLPDAFQKVRHFGPVLIYRKSACELTATPIIENIEQILSHASKATELPECEQFHQCGLVRDIFGNPFRPIAFDPSWHTSTVVALATGIYEEKAFDRMPILADALQDAGCDNEEILQHCRGENVHVRGCFVVDLLLGRK